MKKIYLFTKKEVEDALRSYYQIEQDAEIQNGNGVGYIEQSIDTGFIQKPKSTMPLTTHISNI